MPRVSSIEHLPIELWFMIFEYFDLSEIHTLFYGLNININNVIRGKQNLSASLYFHRDSTFPYFVRYENEIKCLFQNVWSLTLCSPNTAEFLSRYPLQTHFTQLRTLDLYQSQDESPILTIELLHQLRHLELLSIWFAEEDSARILSPILKYLHTTVHDDRSISLKRLVLRNNAENELGNMWTVSTRKGINLDSLYIRGVSSRTFSSLIPEHSEISKVQINYLRSESYTTLIWTEMPLIKSKTITVLSLQINSIDSSLTFDNIKSLINQIISLKKLFVKEVIEIELVNGEYWALLLMSTKIEKFYLEYFHFNSWRRRLTFDEQAEISQAFQTRFWLEERKALINEYSNTFDNMFCAGGKQFDYSLSIKF